LAKVFEEGFAEGFGEGTAGGYRVAECRG